MFPDWLDLPEGYLVQDWMQWQRGKIVADKIIKHPELIDLAVQRLRSRGENLLRAELEWLGLLEGSRPDEISAILEDDGPEGQRLRSSSPFHGSTFITAEENDHVRKRAYPW